MDDPLCVGSLCVRPLCVSFRSSSASGFLGRPWGRCRAQFKDDVLACAMHDENSAAGKLVRLLSRRRLERLGIGAEPRLDNAIAAHAIMNAARNGFNFG